IIAWYMIRLSGLVKPGLVPTPWQETVAFWSMMTKHALRLDMYMSALSVFIGLILRTLCEVPIGFAIGWYDSIKKFLDPKNKFYRALPPIALIPLVIIYFGIGESGKIIVLFYAAFFASVVVMYEGIRQINPLYVRVAKTLGASDLEIFSKV